MKRRRKQKTEDEDESDPLEGLGFGKDRYYSDDDDEALLERRELRAINALHWEN
jgi:hypothetical protein